jgi:serine/threonine-protein kinase
MNLTAGKTLQNGKYALDCLLEEAGLVVTLKAYQAYLNQPVVLKTLKQNSETPTDIAHLKHRFVETARRYARCVHPGLARVSDLFEEGGVPFVAMDFVAGQSLAERVQTGGVLTEAQAIQFVRQVGSALSVIHKQGLVHGNVEPGNLICPSGADFVVLVNFAMPDGEEVGAIERSPSHSGYRAIEQSRSDIPLSAATDIYGLAATFYFLVTGLAPVAAVLREKTSLIPPRQLRSDLSPELEAAILSGMVLDEKERPPTIAAWLAQLPGGDRLTPIDVSAGAALPTPVQRPVLPTNLNGERYSPAPAPPSPPAPAVTTPVPAARIVFPEPKRRLPKAVVGTAAIAAVMGLGLGLVLRFGAAHGIGPKLFNTQQTFPPLSDWVGTGESSTPIAPMPSIPAKSVAKPKSTSTPQFSPSPLPPSKPDPTDSSLPPSPAVIVSPSPAPATNSLPQENPLQSPTSAPAPETSIKVLERAQNGQDGKAPEAVNPQPLPSP